SVSMTSTSIDVAARCTSCTSWVSTTAFVSERSSVMHWTVRTIAAARYPTSVGVGSLRNVTSPVRTADRVGRLVRAGLDHLSFQHEVDAVLRASVGYDLAAWATIDPATLLVTS